MRLLNRTTRKVALTEVGRVFLERGEEILVELEGAELLRHRQVTHQKRSQQVRGEDVEGHHLLVHADRHHCARRAVGVGREVELLARQ